MKSIRYFFLIPLLGLLPLFSYGQEDLKASIGINGASIGGGGSGNSSPLLGLQLGLGTEIPIDSPFYFAPSLWIAQGGQVNRVSGSRFGTRNTYLQLSAAAGYEYPLTEESSIKAEIGPALNTWARAVNFDDFSGTNERNKFNIGDFDEAKRFSVSAAVDVRYRMNFKSYDLSLGLRADLGLTPIESFEVNMGETQRFRARSLAVVGGISYAIDDLLGEGKADTTAEFEVNPEDLILATPYDRAFDSFKKARELIDDSYYSDTTGILPPELAQNGLDELEKTKRFLEEGIEAWENGDNDGIGPEAAKRFREYIRELEARGETMADSTWVVETPPEETPPEETGDDPRDTPPPTIYGEEVDPPWITVEGAMAPSQGVYQDDDYFEDKPTKQITQDEPNKWHAELDMISNRWTAVFGMKGSRKTIYMSGKTTYAQSVPVKFRLKLIQSGNEKIIWTESTSRFSIPIEGGQGPERPWSVYLNEEDDSPVPKAFKMDEGSYSLELELIKENGDETGLKIIAYGEVVSTTMPKVHIVPVLLTDSWTTAEAREVVDHAKRISKECEDKFYNLFPISIGGTDIRTEAIQYLGSQELSTGDYLISLLPLTSTQEEVRKDRLIARLTQRFATTAQLGGEGRVVVVINDSDFARIRRRHEGVGGFAPHPKVQVMKMDNYGTTVAHELIHSLPYLWSVDQMEALCGFNYHNSADDDYGNGVMVHGYGRFFRENYDAVMGSVAQYAYITQCSFWHLIQQFQQPNDPELYLVRGYIAQSEGEFYAKLGPTFEFEGIAGIPKGRIPADGWGIILRDASGTMLASYPFQPEWQDPEEAEPRNLMAINFRIDRLPGTASIEIVGPGGRKDIQYISQNRPELEIASPLKEKVIKQNGKGVKVQWKATDADKDQLTYLIMYSLNDGGNWIPLGDETRKTSTTLPLFGRAKQVKVRVYASDGVNSDFKEVGFYVIP